MPYLAGSTYLGTVSGIKDTSAHLPYNFTSPPQARPQLKYPSTKHKMRAVQFLSILTAATCSTIPSQHHLLKDQGSPLPLIIWHGLGDQYDNLGIKEVAELAEQTNPGTFVYAIRLSDEGSADKRATFIGNINEQIEKVCHDLASHPILSTAPAVNALGFSQGGQFLRAYIQRCNYPPVANLVTFGAQHNGIAEFQACAEGDWFCSGWQGLLKGQTWSSYVQKQLVPAQYYRNTKDLDSYLEYSNFLADINNERANRNQTYAENLKKLEKFVMYLFEDDVTVVPKWSGWFEDYDSASEKRTKLQDRRMYHEDWLGLKWLDERGRLEFKETEGVHMSLSEKLLKDVFREYYSKRVEVSADSVSLDL